MDIDTSAIDGGQSAATNNGWRGRVREAWTKLRATWRIALLTAGKYILAIVAIRIHSEFPNYQSRLAAYIVAGGADECTTAVFTTCHGKSMQVHHVMSHHPVNFTANAYLGFNNCRHPMSQMLDAQTLTSCDAGRVPRAKRPKRGILSWTRSIPQQIPGLQVWPTSPLATRTLKLTLTLSKRCAPSSPRLGRVSHGHHPLRARPRSRRISQNSAPPWYEAAFYLVPHHDGAVRSYRYGTNRTVGRDRRCPAGH